MAAICKILSPFKNFVDSYPFKAAIIIGCGALSYYFFSMRNRKKFTPDTSDSSVFPKSEPTENSGVPSENSDSCSQGTDIVYQKFPPKRVRVINVEGFEPSETREKQEESDLSECDSIPLNGSDTEDDFSANILDHD